MKKGWTYKKLGEVATFARGLTYSKNDEVERSNNIVLRSNNIDLIAGKLDFSELKFLKEDFVIPDDKRLRKGSLFICMSNGSKAHLGKVAYVDKDYGYAFGGFMGQISPNDEIDGLYLHYALSSPFYKEYIKSLSEGANINNLKFKDLSEFTIKYPSLSEQRSIVSRLDATFADIDALKANAEKQLSEARQLFQAELTECMRPKEGWEEKTIDDISVKLFAGGDVPKDSFSKEKTLKYNIPIVSNGIEHDGLYGFTEFAKVCEPAITISGRGTIGYVVERSTPFFPIIRLITIIPNLNVIGTRFLYYALRNKGFSHSGSSIPQLTVPMVKGVKIGIPPIEIQNQIVSRLDALSARIKQLEDVQRKTLAECDALKQAMLREVFE